MCCIRVLAPPHPCVPAAARRRLPSLEAPGALRVCVCLCVYICVGVCSVLEVVVVCSHGTQMQVSFESCACGFTEVCGVKCIRTATIDACIYMFTYTYVCIYICVCVCVCMC